MKHCPSCATPDACSNAHGCVVNQCNEPPQLIETRWLLELHGKPQKFWSGAGWRESALEAARYPDKQTADLVRVAEFRDHDYYGYVEACEHIFGCDQSTGETPRVEVVIAASLMRHGTGGHTMIHKLQDMEAFARTLEAELYRVSDANRRLDDRREWLEKRHLVLESVFDNITDYLGQRSDVKDDADGPKPNEAMSLLQQLEEARR